MSRSTTPRQRRHASAAVAAILLIPVALVGCGRSSSGGGSAAPSSGTASASAPSAAPSTAAAGDFGTLKAICGPGTPGSTTARGLTATQIRIGVTADPGAAVAPGLEQEFFDTAEGFAKWCNTAGGINGRQIVIDKWDAKLFNVGQVMTTACLKDFMLVGNGNALDATGVKVRLGCKLGQIPAYVVSPEASTAGLQAQPSPNPSNQINNGALRLLVNKYPDVKAAGVCVLGSNLASLKPVGLRTQEYLQKLGIKVANYQEPPAQVDNFRPYMEQCKASGAKALYLETAQDPSPVIQAMKNTGWSPDFVVYSVQFYGPQGVQAAAAAKTFQPSYIQFPALPFELKGQYPVLQQTEDIVKGAVPNAKLTEFTLSAMSAWTLWAQSAKDCGANLTQDCILQKAAGHTDWDAGGLYAPHSTKADADAGACITIVQMTPKGFVYAKDVTQPNQGSFNCEANNVLPVKTYL
ncbi:MAG TPA: ABC transporter substrate-binding protein [Frankiaceae bacterium]|nr:ABC transporter substrate-binding protein [Frankiaceae bacterium]